MKVVVSKVVWSLIAIGSLIGLIYIWVIGLPVPEYLAKDDGAKGVVYTIQTAPNTFFDVYMSENEILRQSDWETFYQFKEASARKSSTQKEADLIDAGKQVFGRPGSFCYRKFNDLCTITVDSEKSTYQGLQSLLNGSEYTLYGDITKQKVTEHPLPTLPEYVTYTHLNDYIYANHDFDYDFDEETQSLIWYGPGVGLFYKAQTTYGLMGDITQQLIATATACYKLDLKEYYVGEDYCMWVEQHWVLGVKKINRNTQLVIATNSPQQYDAAIKTLIS